MYYGLMILKLTRHLQERIKERGIKPEYVKKVLEKPDTQSKESEDKVKAVRKIHKKKLVVIYKKDRFSFKNVEEKTYIVITAYYL